jgi:hypothetical protein
MNPKARLTKARERRERMIRELDDIDRGSEYGWELIGDPPVTRKSLFDFGLQTEALSEAPINWQL